jgi:hypothetical protein
MNRVLIFLFVLFTSYIQAQRNCGAPEVLQAQLRQYPDMKTRMGVIETHTRDYTKRLGTQRVVGEVVKIPVVVHVLYKTPQENISDAQIQSQIDALNRDFRKRNNDLTNVPSAFAPLAADIEVEFVLADRNPNGQPTNGITRTATTRSQWGMDESVKSAAFGGVSPWNTQHYLNFWVCNVGGGVLGYAQFPGGPAAYDGIVIDSKYFGVTSNSAQYNLGRTATHEVGHWFNLWHIWGDNDCGDDHVDDTPRQKTSNGGCPTFPHRSTCNTGTNGDMYMNYMDYVDDGCMNMFSQGQKNRMLAVLSPGGFREALANSPGWSGNTTTTTTTPPPTPPTNTTCAKPKNFAAQATAQSIKFSWTPVSGVANYKISYNILGENNLTTVTATGSNLEVRRFSPGSKYIAKIQSVCGATLSDYSADITFTTAGTAIVTAPSNTNCDAFESNESFSAAKTIGTTGVNTAAIATPTDKDWFKFSNSAAAPSFYITLDKLPVDYDFKLYDDKGNYLYTAQESGVAAEAVVWDNAPVGTYYLQIYGYNGTYDATKCYNLAITTSSQPFTRMSNARSVAEEVKTRQGQKIDGDPELKVSPSKNNNSLTITVPIEADQEVSYILRKADKVVAIEKAQLTKTNATHEMNIEKIRKGDFVLEVKTKEKKYTRKLVLN